MSNDNATERDDGGVWVTTEDGDGGAYQLTVSFGDRHSRVLDREAAYRYAAGVLAACQRAEYDAAVIKQMTTTVGVDLVAATKLIAVFREDRAPLDHAATAPIRLEPGVSHRTGKGFLQIAVDGDTVGQWDAADGRSHALFVLECIEVAELDTGYRKLLVGAVGIDDQRARNVVHDLANYRA